MRSTFWNNVKNIFFALAVCQLLAIDTKANSTPKNIGVNFTREKFHSHAVNLTNGDYLNNERSLPTHQIVRDPFTLQPSVDKLKSSKITQDIKPTDWSYQALKALIERYFNLYSLTPSDKAESHRCISSYQNLSDRRGIISRAEFAVGLNACLNQIQTAIANAPTVSQTDLGTLLRLIQEFQSELAILRGKTDGVQARLQDLEATQFSSTTKLKGEAIFGWGSLLSGNENTIFGSRVRIELETSFSGEDLLFTRLSRNDFSGFEAEVATLQGNLAFAEPNPADNVELETWQYFFNLGDRLDFVIGAAGLEAEDLAPTINVLDGDGGSGSISAFGTRNPIYYPPGDAGLGITHRPSDRLRISAGYLASAAEDPSSGSGLFDGPYSVLGQIMFAPSDNLNLAAIYIHSYSQSNLQSGTNRANLQSLTAELFNQEVATVSNSYGLELSWAISDRLVIGGWGGLSKVSNLTTLEGQIDRGTQDIWNWAVTLALLDLGKEGSLGGIIIGSEPRVTNSTIEAIGEDRDLALHLEAFYQYRINDNISVTPGVVWITQPDGDLADEDLAIATVRTTFSF